MTSIPTLIALNEAAYVFCATGACELPPGFSKPQPITATNATSELLKSDPETGWGFVTYDGNGRQHAIFRGTQNKYKQHVFLQEWADDLFALPLVRWKAGRIHRGFADAFDALYASLMGLHVDAVISGHSLGAAIATICAASLADAANLTTFNGPKVGDAEFATLLAGSRRVTNNYDVVSGLPIGFDFVHGGTEVAVQGPYDLLNPHVAHNLESDLVGYLKLCAAS